MSKKIQILSTRPVQDAQVIFIASATYKGSLPFSGVFEIWDADYCERIDENSQKKIVSVRCCWADEPETEDSVLDLEVSDNVTECCIGYAGDADARIGFV